MSSAIDDPEVAGESSENASEAPHEPASAWGDRLRALKNVPPVLHFVWESGPAVVFWNIAIRIVVAFLPVGIGIIGRFIIDGVNHIRFHQPLPQYFWWLVGAEMALAVLTGILSALGRLLRQPARRPLHASRQRRGDAQGGGARCHRL